MKGHQKRITGLAFSTNLNILISSGADAQVSALLFFYVILRNFFLEVDMDFWKHLKTFVYICACLCVYVCVLALAYTRACVETHAHTQDDKNFSFVLPRGVVRGMFYIY